MRVHIDGSGSTNRDSTPAPNFAGPPGRSAGERRLRARRQCRQGVRDRLLELAPGRPSPAYGLYGSAPDPALRVSAGSARWAIVRRGADGGLLRQAGWRFARYTIRSMTGVRSSTSPTMIEPIPSSSRRNENLSMSSSIDPKNTCG